MMANETINKTKKSKNNKDYRWWVWLMLALIFFFGLAGRLYDLNDSPMDFHPTRQLRALEIARGMYYETLEEAPAWQREFAIRRWKAQGILEPPIMERLTVMGYRLAGFEDFRIPRIISIVFWTFGGVGLFLLLRNLVGEKGAVAGMAYYMLLPFPLIASRSIQPEPLMTASIIWSWWAIQKWVEKKSWRTAIIAGLISGIALYIKSHALFFVMPVFLVAVSVDRKLPEIFKDAKTWVALTLAVLPFLIYNIDGVFITGNLGGQFGFYPDLLKKPSHYYLWADLINKTLGIEFFVMAILGMLMLKNKKSKTMFFSIFVGYIFYGVIFAYYMSTHDYYQIPLTPAVAIGISGIAALLIESMGKYKFPSLFILSSLLLFWMAYNFGNARLTLKSANYRETPVLYESLGEKVRSYSVISVTSDYGFPMSYWGWKQTMHWRSQSDFYKMELSGRQVDKTQLFIEALQGADLFLVTNFDEFERQADVKGFLESNYPVFDQGDLFIIFDLRATD